MYLYANALTTPLPGPVIGHRPGEVDPIYTIRLDDETGIVHVTTAGFWTLDEAEDYVGHLAPFIEDSHQRYPRAKVLADRRGTPIQAVDVADRFGQANRQLYRAQDRIAVVVDGNLAMGQIRRRFVHHGSTVFLSYESAETWLLAFI